mgnify:CR=1 FL=1
MRVITPRNKTPRKESSREQQMRVAHQQKQIEKQKQVIDQHDLLHSIFWGKPTREELREVWDKMNEQLEANKINLMQDEIDELMEITRGG